MKLIDLLEETMKMVNVDDLFIIQNNDDLDQVYINKLAEKFKSGKVKEITPVEIAPLTIKLRKDLKKLKEKLSKMESHSEYAQHISDKVFDTPKKFILLDGNHRYLAAKKAKVKQIQASSVPITAEDYVNWVEDGEM